MLKEVLHKSTTVWYHSYEVLEEANYSLVEKNWNMQLALGGWGRDCLGWARHKGSHRMMARLFFWFFGFF